MELDPRHAGHSHTANLKYGVIVFGISVVYAMMFAVCHLIYVRRWSSQGKAAPSSIYHKVVSPRSIPLHTIAWVLILLGLLFHKFSILTLPTTIKRAGRLGFCLVPLDIVLAIRPSLLATSYLDYIALHKWILRVLLFSIILHGLGYFAIWYVEGSMWEKSIRIYNLYGVMAFAMSMVLLLISMRPLRNRFYRSFYLVHNIVIIMFVTIIYWHARPGVGEYIFIALALLTYQLYARISRWNQSSAVSVITSENANLARIRLSLPANYPSQWAPGSHLRLSPPATSALTWLFPSHPFTIYSLPGDRDIELVIKKNTDFLVLENANYLISSPFNSLPVPFFETTDHVYIVCGGSGISLGIPLFRFFNSGSASTANLCWATPAKDDAFILDEIHSSVVIDVYVTRDSVSGNSSAGIEEQGLLATAELIELDDLKVETANAAKDTVPKNYRLHSGRPDVGRIFQPLLDATELGSKAVVVCGPDSMILDVKKWGKQNNVFVFSEFYSF